MKEKKQSNTYPIYFRQHIGAYFCILNEKEAIYIALYDNTTHIQYENVSGNHGGTWVHNIYRDDSIQAKYTQITKVEFNKSYKKARKILQEKLIT